MDCRITTVVKMKVSLILNINNCRNLFVDGEEFWCEYYSSNNYSMNLIQNHTLWTN